MTEGFQNGSNVNLRKSDFSLTVQPDTHHEFPEVVEITQDQHLAAPQAIFEELDFFGSLIGQHNLAAAIM